MARPPDVVLEELLDYIEQARLYTRDMTFEQYASDRKTQRAVERCIEVISEASRHLPQEAKDKRPEIPWGDVAGIGNIFATSTTTSRLGSFGIPCAYICRRWKQPCARSRQSCHPRTSLLSQPS